MSAALEFYRRRIPRWMRTRIRRLYFLPHDLVHRTRSGGEMRPPRGFMTVEDDFGESGRRYLPLFTGMGGLQPGDRVLDIGCGAGPIAVTLTGYLDARGSYEGVDVVRQGVDWCRRSITPRFPNFRFQHLDVYNGEYNPRGRVSPADMVLPFVDTTFDFVLLTSVFTHMPLGDVDRYLSEIHRVMKPGGRCFCTFMLTKTTSAAAAGPGLARFAHVRGESRTIDPHKPERAIAHPEATVRARFEAHGLDIVALHHGTWRLSGDLRGSQDVIVAQRAAR